LSDPTRRGLWRCWKKTAVVNELQEITRAGPVALSTHLGLLLDCGLVRSRREGKRTFYKMNRRRPVARRRIYPASHPRRRGIARNAPATGSISKRILARRHEQAPGCFSIKSPDARPRYGPGRSWQAFGHLLLRVLPPLIVADLGAGEGLLSELLARRCKKVIAVDNSERLFGAVRRGGLKAKKNGLKNLEFRLGDCRTRRLNQTALTS